MRNYRGNILAKIIWLENYMKNEQVEEVIFNTFFFLAKRKRLRKLNMMPFKVKEDGMIFRLLGHST